MESKHNGYIIIKCALYTKLSASPSKRIMNLPWISTLQKNLHSVLAVKEQYPLKVILYWVNNIMPYSVPMKIGCFEGGGGGMPKPNEKETTNSKCWILSLSYEYFQGVESQDSKFIFGVSQRNTPWQRTRITNVWKGSVIKVLESTRIGKLFMFRIFTVEEANLLLLKL